MKAMSQIEQRALTSSWMYCSRKGDARRLSTGMLKKPWISFWCRSMVIRWVRPAKPGSVLAAHPWLHLSCVDTRWFSPALHIMEAMSLETMEPRFLILHCLL